jgi:hypothetical protein
MAQPVSQPAVYPNGLKDTNCSINSWRIKRTYENGIHNMSNITVIRSLRIFYYLHLYLIFYYDFFIISIHFAAEYFALVNGLPFPL